MLNQFPNLPNRLKRALRVALKKSPSPTMNRFFDYQLQFLCVCFSYLLNRFYSIFSSFIWKLS